MSVLDPRLVQGIVSKCERIVQSVDAQQTALAQAARERLSPDLSLAGTLKGKLERVKTEYQDRLDALARALGLPRLAQFPHLTTRVHDCQAQIADMTFLLTNVPVNLEIQIRRAAALSGEAGDLAQQEAAIRTAIRNVASAEESVKTSLKRLEGILQQLLTEPDFVRLVDAQTLTASPSPPAPQPTHAISFISGGQHG